MMKKFTALALASAAFVSAPAEAASLINYRLVGTFSQSVSIFNYDAGTWQTSYSTIPNASVWVSLDPVVTGGWTGSISGPTAFGTLNGVTFSGNAVSFSAYPSSYGFVSVIMKFDYDLGGALPQSVDGFVSAEISSFESGRNSLEISADGPATLVFASVPEPTTWAMMIAGFGLAGAALRTRRKAAPAFRVMQA